MFTGLGIFGVNVIEPNPRKRERVQSCTRMTFLDPTSRTAWPQKEHFWAPHQALLSPVTNAVQSRKERSAAPLLYHFFITLQLHQANQVPVAVVLSLLHLGPRKLQVQKPLTKILCMFQV
ncbi:hypothetical protein PR048_015284 [Dryococelus australis]|uniref:Uncharacterized protein n=1 Tax=Dryococelus australis TaxID=614101 RepID=A0ABQ9HGI5_9NEOP|nr:hypothetical protein PR048_015284 [Dryococelus australis]